MHLGAPELKGEGKIPSFSVVVLERKSGEERGFFVMDFRWITRRLNYWRALMHQWRTASGSNREDTVLQGGYSV